MAGDLDLHREERGVVETGVHGEEPRQAPEQEARAHQQHERERHLGHHQRPSGAPVVARRAPGVPFHPGPQCRLRRLERRDDAHADADDRAQRAREGEHRGVHPDRVEPGQAGRAERHQGPDADLGDGQPEHAAHHREQQALGQELADEPGPAGTERGPHRELPLALRAAGEQQIGHVDAGDREQQEHRGRRRRAAPAARPA